MEDFPRAASEVRPPQQSWKDKGQQPSPGQAASPWWARRAPGEGHTGCQTPLTTRQTSLGSEQTGAS